VGDGASLWLQSQGGSLLSYRLYPRYNRPTLTLLLDPQP